MDDRLILSGWIISGAIFLGVIGALFGGLAGFMARLHGRTPGGLVGWRVLRAVERVLHRDLPPLQAGVLIGAVDGASFLGAIGAVLGLMAGKSEWFPDGVLLTSFLAIAVVVGLAIVFGMTAYLFTREGVALFGTACAAGLAGIYIGAMLADTTGILLGGWIGLLAGFGIGWLGQRGQTRNDRNKRTRLDWEEPEP